VLYPPEKAQGYSPRSKEWIRNWVNGALGKGSTVRPVLPGRPTPKHQLFTFMAAWIGIGLYFDRIPPNTSIHSYSNLLDNSRGIRSTLSCTGDAKRIGPSPCFVFWCICGTTICNQ